MNSRALWVEDVLQFAADALPDGEANNCPIRAVDEHVVDRAEQSSAARHHFVADDVGHAREIIEIRGPLFRRRSTHRYRVRPD